MVLPGAQSRALWGLALVSTFLLCACDFNGEVANNLVDAAVPADARIDGAPPVCDNNNEDLRLCLRFEEETGATMLLDESKYGNHATVANANFTLGFEDRVLVSQADFDSNIAEASSLDPLIALSIDMWLRPAGPINSLEWLFDNDLQWGMYLDAGNRVVCDFGVGGMVASGNDVIVAGTWQHVACVYDGDTVTLYLNAKALASVPFTSDLRQDGGNGSCLAQDCPNGGAEYVGQMETLRVWSIGIDRLTLCQAAGLRDDECPDAPPPPLQ
jgi:hypothetical protein